MVCSLTDIFPAVTLITFVMVICLLSDDKLILEPAVRTEPFLVHRNVGAGFPVSLQVKVTFSPSVFVLVCEWSVPDSRYTSIFAPFWIQTVTDEAILR